MPRAHEHLSTRSDHTLPGRVTKHSHTEVAGLGVYPAEMIQNDHIHFPGFAYLVPLCDPLLFFGSAYGFGIEVVLQNVSITVCLSFLLHHIPPLPRSCRGRRASAFLDS